MQAFSSAFYYALQRTSLFEDTHELWYLYMETIIMLTEIKLCILWIHSPAAHNNVVQFVEIWTKKVGESLQTFLVIG